MPMPNRQIINGEPYRYAFQGQEKDPETGKEAFQLRLWDGRIGRWLTTDPAGQYASPYLGMGNNPISMIDPDGAKAKWKPDKKGNLIAEANDNAGTLATHLDISESAAQTMIDSQGLLSDFTNTDGTGLMQDQILTLDNVYTRSISNSSSDLTYNAWVNNTWKIGAVPEDFYNCWGAACAGSQGKEIKVGVGINSGAKFDSILTNDYSPAGSNLQFGKTVIRFAPSDNNIEKGHGAVYYGTSKDGTIYVYTKNGWDLKPEVMRLDQINNSSILKYGTAKGLKAIHTGYYNPK